MNQPNVSPKESLIARLRARVGRLARSVPFLMTASGVSFIWVVNLLIGFGIWQQRAETIDRTRDHTLELARTLESEARQGLAHITHLADNLVLTIKLEKVAPGGQPADLSRLLLEQSHAFPQVVNIVVTDAQGRIVASARNNRMDLTPTVADLLQQHRQRREDGVVIGAPFVTERGAAERGGPERGGMVIPAARRLEAADGQFAGLLLLLLDPIYLQRAFDERLPLRGGAALLLTADGQTVFGQNAPTWRDDGTTPVNHLGDWPELARALAGKMLVEGGFLLPRDGVSFAVGYRRLAGYDFAVLTTRRMDYALAEWRRDTAAWGAIGLAMSLAIGVLTWFVVRQHERREGDQARLLEASRRIRGILDSMVDAVITINGRGRIQTFNPAAERMFGYQEEEIIGQSINLLAPPEHHGHHHHIRPNSDGAAQRIIGADRELLALRRDGGAFPVTLAVSALIVDSSGDHPDSNTYVGVIRDITRRKQYEAELLASKSAAEQANRAKSEFLSNMSHELRTPLNAIIGFSEILDSEFFGALNERQKACARDIHDSGKHLLEIVNAILDMSRIETGHYELHEEPIDPAETISQCLMMIRDRADENQVNIINRALGGSPPLWVDRRAFRQVIHALLSNAVKFTPAGGSVTITISSDDSGVKVAVADTGVGIAEDYMPHLFQPFRQADNSASRQYEGVGLGLTIAHKLVALHGGALTCESQPGAGATMTVFIPASRLLGPLGPLVGPLASDRGRVTPGG